MLHIITSIVTKRSSSPSQDRIVPTDTGTKPRSHNTCKQYPSMYYLALIFLAAFHSFPVLPDCPAQQEIPSPTTVHLQLPTIPQTTQDVYTATGADRCDSQPPPQARKYSTAEPNMGPDQPHPTGMNRLSTYTILSLTNRKTHVIYMVLYHLHTQTHPPTSCKRDLVPLLTPILITVVCCSISIQLF